MPGLAGAQPLRSHCNTTGSGKGLVDGRSLHFHLYEVVSFDYCFGISFGLATDPAGRDFPGLVSPLPLGSGQPPHPTDLQHAQ